MRGSYNTPRSLPRRRDSPNGLEARVAEWTEYGQVTRQRIDPSDFSTPVLAAQLADVWLEVVAELGRGDAVTAPVRYFLRHVGSQLHASGGDPRSMGLKDLQRRHLDAWESDLLTRQAEEKTDTAYRHATYIFAILRRIEGDRPGTLSTDVCRRLEREPRLSHIRKEGLAPFSPSEVRKIRNRAHRIVHAAVSSQRDPVASEAVALHVLMSLATGEPPEVVRGMTVQQIRATTAPENDRATGHMTSAQRLHHLAKHDLVDQYAVTFRKERAAETYEVTYSRRDHAAHRTLSRSILLTAGLRDESPLAPLFLVRGPTGQVTEATWKAKSFSLREWLNALDIDVEGRAMFGRFRKVVTTAEALSNPSRYLRDGRRHSAGTFFGSYANSPILRAEAGRILVDTIDGYFDAATQGPTVITPEAELLISAGEPNDLIEPDMVDALRRGDLEGPHTACVAPEESPYAPQGDACPLSMTGTCFGCPNALITRDHLPAALAVASIADPERAPDPAAWTRNWKHIWEAITVLILPAFSPDDLENAKARIASVPVDLGTRNDMRGINDH